jgi:hypothetical protein
MNPTENEQSRPAWDDLSPEIQNAWKQSNLDFYPEGSIPAADLDSIVKYDYEMADTLLPVPVSVAGAEKRP